MRKLLVVTAHPDDESIFFGGLIAKYAKAGWQVDLICATRGEASRSGPLADLSNELVSWHRQRELENARDILGLHSIKVFEYPDGNLVSCNAGELEEAFYKVYDEIRPDVVVTFHPDGFTHHPDHVRLSRSATFAYQKYAADEDERRLPVVGSSRGARYAREKHRAEEGMYGKRDWDVQLLYACFPESVATFLKKEHVLPSELYGQPLVGIPDKLITTVIAIKAVAATKARAIRAHDSQKETVLPYWDHKLHPLMQQEYYIVRMKGLTEVFMGEDDRISDRL